MAKNVYSERFLSIIDEIGLSDAKIANRVDSLDKTLMSHIRTGRQGVFINVLSSFFEAFPNVNANYILTGKGPMFIEDEDSGLSQQDTDSMSLSYDELSRLYETTVSRYERLFGKLEKQFNELEQTITKARNELEQALLDVKNVLEEKKTA